MEQLQKVQGTGMENQRIKEKVRPATVAAKNHKWFLQEINLVFRLLPFGMITT